LSGLAAARLPVLIDLHQQDKQLVRYRECRLVALPEFFPNRFMHHPEQCRGFVSAYHVAVGVQHCTGSAQTAIKPATEHLVPRSPPNLCPAAIAPDHLDDQKELAGSRNYATLCRVFIRGTPARYPIRHAWRSRLVWREARSLHRSILNSIWTKTLVGGCCEPAAHPRSPECPCSSAPGGA
jgi:hypothetical protein